MLMSGYGLPYRLIVCSGKFYCFKFVVISKFIKKKFKKFTITFFLEYAFLCKKNHFLLFLLLDRCKLSYLVIDASTLIV